MKRLYVALMGLLLINSVMFCLIGCGNGDKAESAKWVEGGLYYNEERSGIYGVFKILKITDGIYHVRVYSNQFNEPPKNIDESVLYLAGANKKPNEKFGLGHIPVASLSDWEATFIKQTTVSEEELEGYKLWLNQ